MLSEQFFIYTPNVVQVSMYVCYHVILHIQYHASVNTTKHMCFVVFTDASIMGIGGVLWPRNNKRLPVAFFS